MSVQDLRSTWERLGEHDPLWAVLTDHDRKGGRWDVDEFMATGRRVIGLVMDSLREASIELGEHVLDFGCGVGRLSFALARHAPRVTGVDIASSMVEAANALNPHPDRVRFVHFDGQVLPFTDGTFDSVLSLMVLQHMPPAVQLATLIELRRVVRPGGVLILQIPGRRRPPVPVEPDGRRAMIAVRDAPAELTTGQVVHVPVRVTNIGTAGWPAEQYVKVGNHWLAGGAVVIVDDGRADLPGALGPGESVDAVLPVTAPAEPGRFELEIDVVQERVAWWGDCGGQTLRLPVEVVAPAVRAPAAAAQARPPEVAEPMLMGAVPPDLVRGIFEHCGCTVLRTLPDVHAGPEWDSHTYLVRRDA